MTESFSWLPSITTLAEHGGNWSPYFEAVYGIFHRDFVASKPAYSGKRFALKRYPEFQGKSATFWHLISDGKVEDDRLPDMRRCERIAWPRPIIEAIDSQTVRCWRNTRGRSERILLAVEDFSYVVVLDDREDFVLLWTAYYVEHANKRRRMEQEYEKWKSQNG